jgi:hypothetical protein
VILAVNAGVFTEESMKFWFDQRGQTFLKPKIELQGQIAGEDDPDVAVYELRVRAPFPKGSLLLMLPGRHRASG